MYILVPVVHLDHFVADRRAAEDETAAEQAAEQSLRLLCLSPAAVCVARYSAGSTTAICDANATLCWSTPLLLLVLVLQSRPAAAACCCELSSLPRGIITSK